MKDMIDKKTLIFLIITIVFISIIITIGYLSSSKSNYIVIDDYIIEYKNKEFKKANIDDVKGYRFRMLQNQNYIGNYYFDHKEDDINRLFFKNDDGVNAISIPLLGLDDNILLIIMVINSIYLPLNMKVIILKMITLCYM